MIIKYKLSDVAKDFNKSNKEIVELLAKYIEGPKKKATNALDDKELNIIFEVLTQENSVESFDEYFTSQKVEKEQIVKEKEQKEDTKEARELV